MFKYRAISFPLLLALAALVVFWEKGGPALFAVLAAAIGVVAVFEMASLADKAGIPSSRRLLTLLVVGALLLTGTEITGALLRICLEPEQFFKFRAVFRIAEMAGFLICFFAIPAAWLLILFARDRQDAARRAFGSFGVFLMAGFPLLSLILVYALKKPTFFLAMVLITKAADTGGYIVGMLSGKLLPGGNHKIVPSISPKKSWEGTIGGALFSIGVAAIFAACGVLTMPWYGVILLGFVSFLGSFAGDLTESQLKRAANVKDSANWIPGMGGVWDVLDSFIYNAPLYLIGIGLGVF